MFSRILTQTSMMTYSEQIEQVRQALHEADAVVIGAGSGLSTSAGLTYSGPRFQEHFGDFIQKYKIQDMYSGGFYPFDTLEEHWAWWSRHTLINRYEKAPKPVYDELLKLIHDKDYFVLTTNVDHQFQLAGFDKERLFYTQGDYGLWQCSEPCCQKTWDNEETVRRMVAEQRDMRVPSELVPRCPGLRQAHDHEPAVRQHLRPGRGLVCRLFPLRGFPSTAWKRKGGLSGIGRGRQHAGHHQVPVLEDDLSKRQSVLCLRQPI